MEHAAAGPVPLGRALYQRFMAFADLLEVEGSDPRKASSYRRAALALRDATVPVEDLAAAGRLTDLPGIGPVLAAKAMEFVTTGRIAALDELGAQVPLGVVRMLAVRGVGPKLVSACWRQLGLTSITDLAAAAADGRLGTLPGVTPAKAARILEGVTLLLSPLRLLGEVLPVARALAEALPPRPGVGRVSIAGPARRGSPQLERADLVACGEAAAVCAGLAAVAAWSSPPTVAADAGDGLWAVIDGILEDGPPVRVLACGPQEFGTALVWATGSEAHLAEVAAWRQAARPDAPALPRAADEDLVYAAWGLPAIPPELREGWGEVARAAAGDLPARLVQAGDLLGDLHCHSTYSDGRDTVAAMAAAARARGYRYLALADHSRSLVIAHGMSLEALRARRQVIDDLNASATDGFMVLAAAEVEILADGTLDYPDEVLFDLDFCVASLHNAYNHSAERLMTRLLGAIAHPAVDLIGHPTGRRLGIRDAQPVDVPALVAAAAEHHKALEVNGSPERLDLDGGQARLLAPAGVQACLSSDAHAVGGLGAADLAAITARRGGLGPTDVVNTRPWPEIAARRRARMG